MRFDDVPACEPEGDRVHVGETPVNVSPVRALEDIEPGQLNDSARFFETYNAAQGRTFRVTGRGGRKAAQAALNGVHHL